MASTPRFFSDQPLVSGQHLDLPATAARHAQVLRLQPGSPVCLFDGTGGEYESTIVRMGRSDVQVMVGQYLAIEREPGHRIHLALGMPANERMDWLVEKACELGVASIQPLHTERSVLRLSGERAAKKRAHWQGIAVAASEQCGGNRIAVIHPVQNLSAWLARPAGDHRLLLSQQNHAVPLRDVMSVNGVTALDDISRSQSFCLLSGPEGGLTEAEQQTALLAGYSAVSLGARTLRAETAALAALATLTLLT